jgi:cell division protease FtsH
MVMPESERINTAYHESGHALIGKLLPKCDPVHKVTIIPRGRALGVTMSLPAQDRYSYDSEYMLNQISMLFGGRIAEEVFMNQMTTGASNDFERATHIARDMVTRYGMTDALGPMVYAENEGEVFLGRSVTKTTNMSEQTMQKVDSEVRRIIDQQYNAGAQADRGQPGQDARHGQGLARMGNHRQRPARRHHGRQGPASAQGLDATHAACSGGGTVGTPPCRADPAPTAA